MTPAGGAQCCPSGKGMLKRRALKLRRSSLVRLFMAVPIPSAMAGRFSAWAAGQRLPGARWTFSSGLHLTLQFLGETASGRRAAAEECLSAVKGPPFEAALEGLGTFPDWRRPSVL